MPHVRQWFSGVRKHTQIGRSVEALEPGIPIDESTGGCHAMASLACGAFGFVLGLHLIREKRISTCL